MHSGDDLFVETGRDVGAIAAAGRRRTRRNQIGGAAAGGVLALGLVFGIASQTGGNEPDEFAGSSMDAAESELDMAAIASDSERQESSDLPGETVVHPAPGFVPYEVVVGVDDGFAGLRATEVGILAITSSDGLAWAEQATTGLPDEAQITGLAHDDGVFAAPFVVYDELAATSTSYIGTSPDLVSWTVEALDLGEEFGDPFVSDVALTSEEIVAVVMVSPPFDVTDGELVETGDPTIFTIRGPVGGPYDATPLAGSGFGLSGLEAANGVVMFTVSTDEGAEVWASSGGEWTMVRRSSFEEFPTLGAAGSNVYLADSTGVERSEDVGMTWVEVDLPAAIDESGTSANMVSSGETIAVLFSLSDLDGQNDGYVLAAGSHDALRDVSLDGLVPDRAFVNLVAVSDDEALIEVFPEPEAFDEDLAASGGVVEEPIIQAPRYVRVPLA